MSNVRDFGAAGDGERDDTEAVVHALQDGDGELVFPPGDYLLSRTIEVELARHGRFSMHGSGGCAKLIMAAPGPAFHVVGTHFKSANPAGLSPAIWQRERMPTAENIEIEGRHPEASGFLLEGVMQPTFAGVLLRELTHGIQLRKNARNLLVTHCHIYHNRGYGIFLDEVDLHQAIITGSHISYCARGGIHIAGSKIFNLQITGNDIEYNHADEDPEPADVSIDVRAAGSIVHEGTIASNTIQSIPESGGANVRLLGPDADHNTQVGLLAISGNLIGSRAVNVHLRACRGVALSGNVIYNGTQRNLLVEGSRNITCTGNVFDQNQYQPKQEIPTGVRLENSRHVVFTGQMLQAAQVAQRAGGTETAPHQEGLLEVVRCDDITINGCQIADGAPYGILVEDSNRVTISGNAIVENRSPGTALAAIAFRGTGRANFVTSNSLSPGPNGAIEGGEEKVQAQNNLLSEAGE